MRTDRIFATLALGTLVSTSQAGSGASIIVRVVDTAGVDKVSLAAAEKQAAAILTRAGIQVVWQECPPGAQGSCSQALVPNEFWLNISNWRPPGTPSGTLGFAEVHGGDSGAGVYYPMANYIASDFAVDKFLVLGAALVHEIGHLLGEGHSSSGIMRARFNRQSFVDMAQGGLIFYPEQARRIRAELVRRTTGQFPAASSASRSMRGR